ncbi:MAG: N-methylhydantoinase A/acetone carboxylase, beta subunit [Atribacteria bacterium 34_128]|nr:MAG: N-methylhydantoinase A/acetone carboxylase, beta subunit [Atribacteria bacterium 34_128]HBY57719.1 5-oxoprolinase [Candidatus Atribacteria bacterium]
MAWRVGIDIGGAFTDFYTINSETGKTSWLKIESTPPNFEIGVIQGIEELEKQGIYIKNVSQIIHGQTVVINTIITRSGSNVGFITTNGYDILEIQRANRRDIFNFKYKKPTPFVSGYMVERVSGYIDADGSIHKPLKENEIKKATESIYKKGAESFAIGFINSYCNTSHELKAKEIVEKTLKENGVEKSFVTISSDLSREWREYERFNTAVLNAYVQPLFVEYIEKLEKVLKEKGFNGVFYLTLASGGMTSIDFAKEYPITTIEGGPISGIIGGATLGYLMNENDIIVIDGGSTTTKAGLAKHLIPQVNTEYWIEQNEWNAGYPTRVPAININEIGTGGTSIVWVDEAGNLQVGPKAAGSRPGPACYEMGGEEPTLTDAYVVTGYLNPEYLLGGKLKINKKLAEDAFNNVAKQLKLDIRDVAYGAIMVANDNSSNLIRLISIRKGFDPREFTLIAHGGSGPMIAPFIAKELSVSKIIVPTIPSGVFNAWGMIGLDIRHELVQTNIISIEESEGFINLLNITFKDLENKIKNVFESEEINISKIEIQRYLDIQYEGQAHTLKVQCPNGVLRIKEINKIIKAFHDAHFREYGFNLNNSGIEIVNFHVAGLHRIEHPKIEKQINHNLLENALLGERKVYNGNAELLMKIYKKEKLPAKVLIESPCIIEGNTSTIIVTENFSTYHDEYGNLIMLNKE